jgi:hypothetical protein
MSEYTLIQHLPDYMRGSLGEHWEVALIEYELKVHLIGLSKNDNKVTLSDEPYWNKMSPTGDTFSEMVALANLEGLEGGVVITPYALQEFGGTATVEQLVDMALRADFVVIDPYYLDPSITPERLLQFASDALEIVRGMGKEIGVIVQGFAHPGLEDEARRYNEELASMPWDYLWVGDAIDFWDIPDSWQLYPGGYGGSVLEWM